jgi:hypothetical protein
MLQPISPTVSRLTRPVIEHLEAMAEARRRGDHAAADAAEMAAYTSLRTLLAGGAEAGR